MKNNDGLYEMLELKENVDYNIIIDLDENKALIRCKCGTTTTLGKKDNNFLVSYMYYLSNVRIIQS